MKTTIQPGDRITVAAPAAITAGAGVLVGSMFGVAQNDAASGADLTMAIVGVYELTKVGSQAWTVGALIYWDDTNKRCTTSASGNTKIGVCVEAVANGAGDVLGRVRLNGAF